MDTVTEYRTILGSMDEIRTGEKYLSSLKNKEHFDLVGIIKDIEESRNLILKINLIGVYQHKRAVDSTKIGRRMSNLINWRYEKLLNPSPVLFPHIIALGYDDNIIKEGMLREYIKDDKARLKLIPYTQMLNVNFQEKEVSDMDDYGKEMMSIVSEVMAETDEIMFDINIKRLSEMLERRKSFFEEGFKLYSNNLNFYGLTSSEYNALQLIRNSLDIIKNPDKSNIILPPPGMDLTLLNKKYYKLRE